MVLDSHVERGRHHGRLCVTHDQHGWVVVEEQDGRITHMTGVVDWHAVEQMVRRFAHRALQEEAGAVEPLLMQ